MEFNDIFQLHERIIPEFERLHGPEYQALIMVDNSQGHSAYSSDAILVSRMNLNLGGTQPKLRDGWYICNDHHILQKMVFPADHLTYPDQPKGVK